MFFELLLFAFLTIVPIVLYLRQPLLLLLLKKENSNIVTVISPATFEFYLLKGFSLI